MPDSRPNEYTKTLVLAVGMGLTLFVLWLAVGAAQAFFQPLPPTATPSTPKAIVVMPSPDGRLRASADRIDANTAILPTIASILATQTAGQVADRLHAYDAEQAATWAATQHAALH